MGVCLSLCRRRRPRAPDPERAPLLPAHAHADPHPPPPPPLLDAVNDGRLPTQVQINHALSLLLASPLLTTPPGGQGPLSVHAKNFQFDSRHLVLALIQFGADKNYDDCLQQIARLLYQAAESPVKLKLSVDAPKDIPTQSELTIDSQTLLRTVLLDLIPVIVSPVLLRAIFADVLHVSRDVVADAAKDVAGVAELVLEGAEAVEVAVRPEDTQQNLPDLDASRLILTTDTPDPYDRITQVVIQRIADLVVYARHDIQLRSKIVALLSLLQKYAETSTSLGEASLEVHVDADSEETPSDILQLLRLFLTRFAPPKHVDTLIAQARVVVRSLFSVPDIAIYLRDLKVWFERATKSQDDMQSQKQVIEDLYERGKELVTRADAEGGSTMTHIGLLLAQIDQVWTCVKNDRSMKQVATALIRVGRHLEQTTLAVAKPSQQRTQIEQEFIGEILVDITQWAVPRLLASLHSFAPIVIPRVEYTRSVGGSAWAADAVLDGLKLTSASFVPDHIVISNRNEIHLTPSNSLLSPGEQPIARPGLSLSSAWTKLHIDGLRLSIHDISYSVRFRRQRPGFFGRFLGWQDSGLLSVDLGQPSQSGTGLALNLDLHSSSDTGTRAFYEVRDSSADIAGLSLQFDKSRHWIFNQFLVRPLVVPVIRHALQSALEGAMQESARALDRMAFEAWWRVTQRRMAIEARGGTPDFWDYLDAARPPPSTQPAEVQENGHEAETNDVETVTKTQLTTKGIIRTTHATEEAAAAEGPDAELNHDPVRPRSASDTPIVLTPNESVVAVGVAGQILPDLSGPTIQ